MTWNWNNARHASSGLRNDPVHPVGGNVGSVAEAATPGTWPEYDAQYLANALRKKERKYGEADQQFRDETGKVDETLRQVYLDKVSDDYKVEAEQALKHEFSLWLQGKHPANVGGEANVYHNGEGRPVRRWTYRNETDGGVNKAGEMRSDWKHTHWGQSHLTHLHGVRDYLRDEYQSGLSDEIKMNLLADHGPQNLEQAWMYFKHWVKGRPVTDATMLVTAREGQSIDNRSVIGSRMPASMDYSNTLQYEKPVEYKHALQHEMDPSTHRFETDARMHASQVRDRVSMQERAIDDAQIKIDERMAELAANGERLHNRYVDNQLFGAHKRKDAALHHMEEVMEEEAEDAAKAEATMGQYEAAAQRLRRLRAK